MRKGVKFRIYPNHHQRILLAKTFGCCRKVYNKGLALRKETYEKGDKAGYKQTSAMLTEMKKDPALSYLKEVDSIALQQSLRDLNTAFVNFFEGRTKYPKFKSKHDHNLSYRTLNQNNNIRIEKKKIKLPKLGWVKIKQSMPVGRIHNVTIEQNAAGKYFAVLNVDFETEFHFNRGDEIGIDVGIKEFYTGSNGKVVSNPKYLEKSQKRLTREQKRLARKQKGSRNKNKQRIKVARVHEKVVNQRNDFLQKESTKLVRENQTICIETLKVKNMVRNRKLAKSISSASWGKFFTMLEYKSKWYGNTLIEIPTFYASSQTCSVCGEKNPAVKDLSIREWDCPHCGAHHDRDMNAAINILNKGLSMTA